MREAGEGGASGDGAHWYVLGMSGQCRQPAAGASHTPPGINAAWQRWASAFRHASQHMQEKEGPSHLLEVLVASPHQNSTWWNLWMGNLSLRGL